MANPKCYNCRCELTSKDKYFYFSGKKSKIKNKRSIYFCDTCFKRCFEHHWVDSNDTEYESNCHGRTKKK